MKHKFKTGSLANAIILLVLFTFSAYAQDISEPGRRFEIKSGHIEYELTGNATGTRTIWFDNYGALYYEQNRTEEHHRTLRGTEKVENHTLEIFDGTWYYHIDMLAGEGTKMHKRYRPDAYMFGDSDDESLQALGQELLNAFGGKVEKDSETVLGRSCDVTTLAGTTVWQYKGLTLKSHARLLGIENKAEAISFRENITVPSSLFQPPANVIINEVTDLFDDEDYYGYDDFDYYDDDEFDDDFLINEYPTRMDFEEFKEATGRAASSLGFDSFRMWDDSYGEYSALYVKENGDLLTFSAVSLQANAGWREEINAYRQEENITNFELFRHGRYDMFYGESSEIDEETGALIRVSILFAAVRDKDALLTIVKLPTTSKRDMIDTFTKTGF